MAVRRGENGDGLELCLIQNNFKTGLCVGGFGFATSFVAGQRDLEISMGVEQAEQAG